MNDAIIKNIYFKADKKKGVKGDKGDIGISDIVPVGGIIAYDGDDIPEGYEEVAQAPPAPVSAITQVFGSGAGGQESYTIEDDGLYLLVAVYTHNGYGSISLPQGRTSLFNDMVGDVRGFIVNIAELQAGDIVNIIATASSWIGQTKQIFKLDSINIEGRLLFKGIGTDTRVNVYNDMLGEYTHALCIGAASARSLDGVADETVYKGGALWHYTVPVNSIVAVNYINYNEFPDHTYTYYGYDGGFGGFIAIE